MASVTHVPAPSLEQVKEEITGEDCSTKNDSPVHPARWHCGMYERFQNWAIKNYGDSGKTKTVTRKKYQRIVSILNGAEKASTDNSKFRFWVKAKGFRLGQSPAYETAPHANVDNNSTAVYVPTRRSALVSETERTYKKVAVVEDFFTIIYSVHVEMDGRGGKHAGQKRTYRAIAETYSFLPREAVTKFLMSCADCQKRMQVGAENNNNNNVIKKARPPGTNKRTAADSTGDGETVPPVDYSSSATHNYLDTLTASSFIPASVEDEQDSLSSADSDMSVELSTTSTTDASPSLPNPDSNTSFLPLTDSVHRGHSPMNVSTPHSTTTTAADSDTRDVPDDKHSVSKLLSNNNNNNNNNNNVEAKGQTSGNTSPTITSRVKSPGERKRRASDELNISNCTKASDLLDDYGRDDDDNDDDDDDEKLSPGQNSDPEKLKAFNMFVRLFVDENLDRNVPISKQPKDKIQAILEACDRQFPEFHNRSRKRIRTYLKSCRRMRRSKDHNGLEALRPTPPHLTSAAAEGILAQACENESNNAKRIRMGLDPLPCTSLQPLATSRSSPTISAPITSQPALVSQTAPTVTVARTTAATPSQTVSLHGHFAASADYLRTQQAAPAEYLRAQQAAPTSFRPPSEYHQPFFASSNGLFRPGFTGSYQTPAHHHSSLLTHASVQHNQIQNGPTDLSLKKSCHKNQLSSTEVVTIKQLIAGYRESAAFLYRSADELEQLLLQQN